MKNNNIVDLATVIQKAMKDYIENTPDCTYEGTINVGMRAALKFGKGQYNPNIIDGLVNIERSVYENCKYKGSLPC